MRLTGSKAIIILPAIALAAWVFWLRWPTFGHVIWNLDEGIHATVARTIVDGGVMYRDAVDQRTPLTYYIVATVFGVFGSNNVWAVHALLAAVVATTAIGLFLLGRRWQGSAAGIWAALVFCALSTNLLHQADSNSISTEWFVSLFTTLSAWWFWRTWEQRSFGQAALAGAGFAAAFLSKQPGLLELGVPLVFVLHAACTRRIRPAEAARMIAGLCAGFTAVTAPVFG